MCIFTRPLKYNVQNAMIDVLLVKITISTVSSVMICMNLFRIVTIATIVLLGMQCALKTSAAASLTTTGVVQTWYSRVSITLAEAISSR